MNRGENSNEPKKQRFKGIENFLRRIAFNLGNSPSQTEVKIISCIPIDVTDLQQKIVCLEKQLEDRRKHGTRNTTTVCHATLCSSNLLPRFSTPAPCPEFDETPDHNDNTDDEIIRNEQTCVKTRNSNNSIVIPKASNNIQKACESCRSNFQEQFPGYEPTHSRPREPAYSFKQERPHPGPPSQRASEHMDIHTKMIEQQRQNKCKELKKLKKKKEKINTQLVYYTHTMSSPFQNYNTPAKVIKKTNTRECEGISCTYLADMIRKQYKPEALIQRSNSDFSSPVCRDIDQCCRVHCAYDSDVCSCCHGMFKNIDSELAAQAGNKLINKVTSQRVPYNDRRKLKEFYDADHYDVIPVKEKPAKMYKPRRKDHAMNAICGSENIRTKNKPHHWIVNCPTVAAARVHYTNKLPVNKNAVLNRSNAKIYKLKNKVNQQINTSTLTSNNVGQTCRDLMMTREPIKTIVHKNAECLTHDINHMECQTAFTKSVQQKPIIQDENKTETTLNRIKSILQSVLAEVKANNQLKYTKEDNVKKDVFVQKGASQNNMGTSSRLIQSFTYSPYNMNPYLSSYSHQLPSGSLCCSTLPCPRMKYLQNFPLLVETPQRMCNNCYRQPQVTRSVFTINATDVTTNTDSDSKCKRGKETQELIKEIYKSLTLEMDAPTKDTSDIIGYKDVKLKPIDNINKSETLENKIHTVKTVSKVNFKTEAPKDNSAVKSGVDSKLLVGSTDTDPEVRREKVQNYLDSTNIMKVIMNPDMDEVITRNRNDHETTLSDQYSETSESDTETEIISAKETQKKAKRGLFSKLFNPVKLFKTKEKKKKEPETETDGESDNSDDYQTIYSQKIDKYEYPKYAVNQTRRNDCRKYPPNIVGPRRNYVSAKPKICPYMEQEYRRHWQENLMFHKDQRQHDYSCGNPSTDYTVQQRQAAPFWQSYEARNASIDYEPENKLKTAQMANFKYAARNRSTCRANVTGKRLAWMKNHKLRLQCGPEWKKLIMDG